MNQPLHVAINARLTADGTNGGIFQFTQSLITELVRLSDGGEKYTLITHPTGAQWAHELSPSCVRVVAAASVTPGFYDTLGADVVHFPYQAFFKCQTPTVFNPHDLQHLHLPQFFSAGELERRAGIYPAGCRDATAVAVAGAATKADVVAQFGVDPAKVFVIPVAVPTERSSPIADPASIDRIRLQFNLPERFAMYPAQTWKHKNHLGLIDAVALLRDQGGPRVCIVCTGKQNEFWEVIRQRISELQLNDQVIFLGYVPAADLNVIYQMTDFIVYPSLFEGGSFPMLEAFGNGIAVASSNVTTLPEYGGDAVLFFDPASPASIAQALGKMWNDPDLRWQLAHKGSQRIAHYTWPNTARAYRALYRKLANRTLAEEDQRLLAAQSASIMPLPAPVHSDVPRSLGR